MAEIDLLKFRNYELEIKFKDYKKLKNLMFLLNQNFTIYFSNIISNS